MSRATDPWADVRLPPEAIVTSEYRFLGQMRRCAPTARTPFSPSGSPQQDCAPMWIRDPEASMKLRVPTAPSRSRSGGARSGDPERDWRYRAGSYAHSSRRARWIFTGSPFNAKAPLKRFASKPLSLTLLTFLIRFLSFAPEVFLFTMTTIIQIWISRPPGAATNAPIPPPTCSPRW